jgi:hypothetical protein
MLGAADDLGGDALLDDHALVHEDDPVGAEVVTVQSRTRPFPF